MVCQISSDKYHFRLVLFGVLELPCTAAWLYVLLFHVPSFLLAAIMALVLGLGTALLAASGIHLLGHAMVGVLDRWLGQDDRN